MDNSKLLRRHTVERGIFMISKHGLAKAILVAVTFGIILGIILGVTKTEMPIWGYAILGAILGPIGLAIYTSCNKK